MHRGHTLRVEAITANRITVHGDRSYELGPPTRGHEAHAPLKVGDVLVVAKDSLQNGDTLVTLPCQCQQLLLGAG